MKLLRIGRNFTFNPIFAILCAEFVQGYKLTHITVVFWID